MDCLPVMANVILLYKKNGMLITLVVLLMRTIKKWKKKNAVIPRSCIPAESVF